MKEHRTTPIISETELDKDITFEISKEMRVTTKVTYNRGEIVGQLLDRIKRLEEKVEELHCRKTPLTDSLGDLWENEYDAKWDQC